ncbi:MAG: Vng1025h, partial [uncultured Craurococcus sp.]
DGSLRPRLARPARAFRCHGAQRGAGGPAAGAAAGAAALPRPWRGDGEPAALHRAEARAGTGLDAGRCRPGAAGVGLRHHRGPGGGGGLHRLLPQQADAAGACAGRGLAGGDAGCRPGRGAQGPAARQHRCGGVLGAGRPRLARLGGADGGGAAGALLCGALRRRAGPLPAAASGGSCGGGGVPARPGAGQGVRRGGARGAGAGGDRGGLRGPRLRGRERAERLGGARAWRIADPGDGRGGGAVPLGAGHGACGGGAAAGPAGRPADRGLDGGAARPGGGAEARRADRASRRAGAAAGAGL